MKDCRAHFNIQNMMYEELHNHFEQAEVAKKDRSNPHKGKSATGFFHWKSVKAPPLKLQNCFEELDTYDMSESVATGSTNITTIEGASSIKKHGVDKQSFFFFFFFGSTTYIPP